jgi:Flp pilus assembly protein CpaB
MARTVSRITERPGRSLLLLALLFAIVAAVLVFLALNKNDNKGDESAAAGSSTTKVVVAAQDISARTTLDADMLKVDDVPTDSVLKGSFSNADDLDGQVTRYPLLKGEQVVASKVGVQKDDETGLSFVFPQGMRAFSIQVSEESSAGGLILPGDLVDIIGILDEGTVGIDKAATLVQGVEVLAVAQEAQEALPVARPTGTVTPAAVTVTPSAGTGTLGERPENVEANPKARTVTLAVTQEQAQLLALVQAKGELALSLRSFGDKAQVSPPETNLIPWGAVPKTLSP